MQTELSAAVSQRILGYTTGVSRPVMYVITSETCSEYSRAANGGCICIVVTVLSHMQVGFLLLHT